MTNSKIKLIKINRYATKPEEYASLTDNAQIRIQARRRIGTRDSDDVPIIETWWIQTDLLAYIPAWDLKNIHKGRDKAVINPQSDFYPSWWYRPWKQHKNQIQTLTIARSSFDIHPDDYQQLKVICLQIREQIGKEFLLSRHGLAWGWKDFKII